MIKELKVLECGKYGAKFEGGIKIPYNEMKGIYKRGQKVLVYIAEEDRERGRRNDLSKEDVSAFLKDDEQYVPITSAKIYNQLLPTEQYHVGDVVEGIVYEIKPAMGAFVAVDDSYHGLVPLNEMYKEIAVGNRIHARVTKVTDGKLRLSVRKKAKEQLELDVEILLAELQRGGGVLYLTDDSDPEVIKKRLNLSKKAFKRAVGRLLKRGEISLKEDSIVLLKPSDKI